jgi:hypothetical protein
MALIVLRMGDWSRDGHGSTADVVIETSESSVHLVGWVNAGLVALGLPVSGGSELPFCADFEDDAVPEVVFEAFPELRDAYADDRRNGYAQIWLALAAMGRGRSVRARIRAPQVIHIGGYGLFYG